MHPVAKVDFYTMRRNANARRGRGVRVHVTCVNYSIIINDEQGEKIWEKPMVGVEAGLSQISFDFSASEIVERTLSGMAESNKESLRTVPLNFRVMVEPIEGEAETKNNQVVFSIDANMRKNQLLILDSRPRWETRYLNNLFERDERWEVSCVWGIPEDAERKLPRGEDLDKFPRLLDFCKYLTKNQKYFQGYLVEYQNKFLLKVFQVNNFYF